VGNVNFLLRPGPNDDHVCETVSLSGLFSDKPCLSGVGLCTVCELRLYGVLRSSAVRGKGLSVSRLRPLRTSSVGCFPPFATKVRRYGHVADALSYANALSCLRVWQQTRERWAAS
jgi:hypothetical protein